MYVRFKNVYVLFICVSVMRGLIYSSFLLERVLRCWLAGSLAEILRSYCVCIYLY